MTGDAAQCRPRLGCGAVVIRTDGKLLLGKRRRAPEAGCWGWLGGKVEWMEAVQDAVAREIREEADVEIRIVRLLCVVDQFETELTPPQHWVSPVYLADHIAGDARVMEPGAIEALGWFDASSLPQPITHAVRVALPFLAGGKPADQSRSYEAHRKAAL
ncbi:NUDIX domain-containing protein [Rhodopseudomonas palustris]|uniref:NUDIX hydrolase n=1 Tax=Rhodopseudomonas palustris (strain BisB18) TaxID=316056 RepID=Q215Y1_RHOPB